MLNYPIATTIVLAIIAGYFYLYKFFYKYWEGYKNPSNLILIGDSILNNSNYVSEKNNVENKLKLLGYNVTCLAKDNTTLDTIDFQLNKLNLLNKKDVIIISVGGNDILARKNINDIEYQYEEMIKQIKNKGYNRILILDVYYPPFVQCKPFYKKVSIWNNSLTKFTNQDCNVVRISKIMNSGKDFVYEIEPSEIGSEKIANYIDKYLSV